MKTLSQKKILFTLAIFLTLCLLSCSSPPQGVQDNRAEQLAEKLYQATNTKGWEKTAAVSFSWDGSGEHHYFWDKKRKMVEVRWDDVLVRYKQEGFQGTAFINEKQIQDAKKTQEHISQAHKYFVNDAFWLNPVFHLNSPGVEKSWVANDQLLIQFKSGGVTPGDSYLFTFREDHLVKTMKMWVSILPIKGITVDFKNYETTQTGVRLALDHEMSILNVKIREVVMYEKYPISGEKDRFGLSQKGK